MSELENIFTNIYNQNLWQMGQNESRSGLGSSEDFTKNIQQILPQIVTTYNIKNMIDTSCGDLFWMRKVLPILNCDYMGLDIVEEIINANTSLYTNLNNNKIEFKHSSLVEYLKSLPDNSVDLILCRHTCEHLPEAYVMDFINEAKRVSKYLLLTTHKNAPSNRDVELTQTPYRPIVLNLSPYSELLDKYQIDSLYDGPQSHCCPEMYINLYKFN